MSKEIKLQKKSEWLTKDEKNIIRKQFFPAGASDLEMQYCMKVAESLGLNPILKQIYFVPRRQQVDGKWVEKIEPLAGRDSFLHIAHKTKKLETILSFTKIIEKPVLKDGVWEDLTDLSATAVVSRTDRDKDTEVTVYYSEYVQLKKDGTPTKFWKEKPLTMLKKVAESQALRKAFNITSLYDDIEVNQNDTDLIDSNKKIKENANKKKLDFDEAEIVEAEQLTEKATPPVEEIKEQEKDLKAGNGKGPGF